MISQELGYRKVVYQDGKNIRAIKGFVTINGDFIIVQDKNHSNPIWINKRVVQTIKNIQNKGDFAHDTTRNKDTLSRTL